MPNKKFTFAKNSNNDEFYTQLYDIENELKHYKEHFKNKTVYCNCDDPDYSNFYFFFSEQFQWYGLKKLITTHYNSGGGCSYKIEITYKNGTIQELKIPLKENGDFRSQECVELLKESDIVVTNPPFSLFREYVDQLIEYNKKFLIIGNQNAIGYNNIFKLIKENKIWLGYGFHRTPFFASKYENYSKGKQKEGMIQVNGCHWFTNLEHNKRYEELILWKSYNPNEYPKYYNYDAINIDKTVEIPKDYKGEMGVPISFLDKFNPNQFEIIGIGVKGFINFREEEKLEILKDGKSTGKFQETKWHLFCPYTKSKKPPTYKDSKGNYYYTPYKRLIIKNKMLNK